VKCLANQQQTEQRHEKGIKLIAEYCHGQQRLCDADPHVGDQVLALGGTQAAEEQPLEQLGDTEAQHGHLQVKYLWR